MKKLFLYFIGMIYISMSAFAQTHMKTWYIPNSYVDMTLPQPHVAPIVGSSAPTSALEVTNGAYDRMDPTGKPMFYIADGSVYSGTYVNGSNLLGTLGTFSNNSSELAIAPFPDNDGCGKNKYYIFYSAFHSMAMGDLKYSIVDMNGNNGAGTLSNANVLHTFYTSFGEIGIAVGMVKAGKRNLYFAAGIDNGGTQEIYKTEIGSGGTLSTSLIYFSSTNDFETRELDINADETMLAFAATRESSNGALNSRYYLYHIVTGLLDHFDVGNDNSRGGRGVEFYYRNGTEKLIVGAGTSGLYEIDPTNPSGIQIPVPNTTNYGTSQIELASNGFLYVCGTQNIAAIKISNLGLSLSPFNDIAITPTVQWYGVGNIYTLPDQIDYENYDNSFTQNEPTLDLYIKDALFPNDVGTQPNPDNGPMWVSPDIWIKNTPTQTPEIDDQIEWNITAPNYIFVRIRNRSCVDYKQSSMNAKLRVNWVKASTNMFWPNDWDDQLSLPYQCGTNNLQVGGRVFDANTSNDYVDIPDISAYQSTVIMIPWHPPVDPTLWGLCFTGSDYIHYCLFARIEFPSNVPSPLDQTGNLGQFVYDNAKNENNCAWHNFAMDNTRLGIIHGQDCGSESEARGSGVVMLCNPYKEDKNYYLEFKVDERSEGIPIFEQAEITATLDETTWQKWQTGGQKGENITISRDDCRQIRITGSPAYLRNLAFTPQERTLMALSFNFISEKVDDIPSFDYHLIQYRTNEKSIIGGELYKIGKPNRDKFYANSGSDKNILSGQSTTLSADDIGEPAYYNWYNETGALIYSGKDFAVDPSITTKYNLQIIAKIDGFTSYDEVIVHVKEFQISSISPNPASTDITVEYVVKQGTTGAYFSICPINSNSSNNYVIDPAFNSTSLNLSGLGTGSYYIRLIANGVVKDEKTFVIAQ